MKNFLLSLVVFFLAHDLFAQNVGIGTDNPLGRLHVSTNGSNLLLIENTQLLNTDTTTGLYFKTGSGAYPYTGAIKTIGQGSTESRLGLYTYASGTSSGLKERLSILDNGNVGIGITTPSNKLSISGNADVSGSMGIGTTTPATSAKLDISSTTQGFLPPRLTIAQRNGISNPAEGLEIWNTDCKELQVFNGTTWTNMIGGIACLGYIPSITICNQVWMQKNLDVSTYRNGDPIPQVTDASLWANLTTGAWCWYNNDSATYGATYGKLYNWYAVNDTRGLAPQGWHVPSDAEWSTLSTCLGGDAVAGGKMKEAGTAHWGSPNAGADNSSGFAGLPGGYRDYDGTFLNVGNLGVWWSSTEASTTFAWYRYLYYYSGIINRNSASKQDGFSVRCLRD